MTTNLADALRQLAETWKRIGCPVEAQLGDPISAAELRSVLEPVGLCVGPDLTTWFGWHNGRAKEVADIGPALIQHSIHEAVDCRNQQLDLSKFVAEQAFIDTPVPQLWETQWLPLLRTVHGGAFGIDCSSGIETVYRMEVELRPVVLEVGSLSDLVLGWIELINQGFWRWENNGWHSTKEEMSSDLMKYHIWRR